jgi:hypothetical protein
VRFFTAAALVNRLEQAHKQSSLDRFLTQLDRVEVLVCDELGYLSFSRTGAELLFQVFADRYERKSLLITSNLAFGEWGQVFQGERMTAALLDRLTHRCHIFEMNGESFRFRESMKTKKGKVAKDPKDRPELRQGNLPGYHLLADAKQDGLELPLAVVDFHEVYTAPIQQVKQFAAGATPGRLRLCPPYKEHLAQAFARFFMRVGLPVPIPRERLKNR